MLRKGNNVLYDQFDPETSRAKMLLSRSAIRDVKGLLSQDMLALRTNGAFREKPTPPTLVTDLIEKSEIDNIYEEVATRLSYHNEAKRKSPHVKDKENNFNRQDRALSDNAHYCLSKQEFEDFSRAIEEAPKRIPKLRKLMQTPSIFS